MNLMSDFAFKRIFGSKERKHLLIRFLNIIFEKDNLHVNDLEFHDKEILPPSVLGKQIIYDVYCTLNGEEEHIILEMQRAYHELFESRTVYYAAKAIASQGMRGWNYDLKPVYSIFVLDFFFSHMTRSQLHDVRLLDVESHEQYTDLMRMIFLHLSEVKKDWDDCKTDYDKILFIIKNMYNMDKESKAYKSGEFNEFFEESEIDNLVKEDYVAYSQSNLRYWEDQAAVDFASRKSKNEGFVEGMEKEKRSIALNLKSAGIDLRTISAATGLPIAEIEAL